MTLSAYASGPVSGLVLQVASACLWMTILLCAKAFGQTSPAAEQQFREARTAQNAGDYGRAVLGYQAAVKLDPTLTAAYLNLGLIEYIRQHYDASIAALDKAQSLLPDIRGANLYLGLSYRRLNRPKQALPFLQRAAAAEPSSKEALTGLADALWETDNIAGSLRTLRRAASLFPADTDVLFLLGEAYRKAYSRQAEYIVENNPDSAVAHVVLAELYTARSEWLKAEHHSRLALEKNPRSEKQNGLTSRAEADYAAGNFEAAASALETVVEQHRASLEARHLLSKTYRELSNDALGRLLQIDGNSARTHALLGRVYETQGQSEQALEEFRRAAEIDPSLPDIHFDMGHLLWTLGRADQALEALRRELELNVYHAEANAEIGTIFVARQEPGKGIPYLKTALRLKPDLMEAHRQLGKAYHETGMDKQAAPELLQAATQDRDGSTHYLLAVVFRDLGRESEAKQAFATCQKLKAERLGAVNDKVLRP